MAIPSSLYNTDTIATYGTTEIELTKKIEDLYPTAEGTVDNSIAYTKYDASWLYTAGVTCYPYEDGGESVKFAEYEPDSSYCYKYYNWESDVPVTDANVNVCIITPGSGAGYYYINSESIIDYGINDSRFVRNAQTNKMLFTAQARRINLTELEPYEIERGSASHVFPLQTVDLKYIDSHPDEYFYDFSLTGCLVWNGSDWIAASYVPAYISTSSSSQGIATINTCFNRRGIYYDMDVRQDSELYIHEDGSSDGFEANGATGWSLGWEQNVEVAPYYIGIGDMANLNALIEAEIEGEETRIDIITCQRAIPVNDIWYYFTWCSGVYYNHPDGVRNASHSSYYCPCIKGSTLSKLIAGCGLYFLADPNADLTGITPITLGNCNDVWLGEMNGDYITTGNWVKGANINSYTGANREGNVFNGGFDPNYVPQPPSPEDGDDIDPNSFGGGSKLGGVDNIWLLTAQQLSDLHTAFNNNSDPNFEPLNSIISVLGLAISPLYIFGDDISTVTNITIKKADGTPWSSGVSGHICSSQVSSFGLTGNISIKRKYNNFLDYPPYASHEMFIPLCGWVPLPSCCVGRKLSVYYVPDIQTGGVRGLVLCDGCIVAEKYGILGANIPFTSNGHGLMLGGIISGGVQTLADFATAMGGLATGNAMATVYGGSSFFSDGFNMALAANQNRTSVIGQNQDRTGFSDGTTIRIKSVYQNVKIDPLFGHTVGYMCHESGQLTNFHGFTVCENPHVHISATSTEKEEIKRLLEEGVILP